MGTSQSSLLDEASRKYIREQAEAELKAFSPHYIKQFSVAWFSQLENNRELQKEQNVHLLKQRESPAGCVVLYEDSFYFFEEGRKWRERYVVVRANYCLECHDSLETFIKGSPPLFKLLPTGGNVVTNEQKYMTMVDECFPSDNNCGSSSILFASDSKEEFSPPLSGMPGEFPVYIRLPYRRDFYFCFSQQGKQMKFITILSDCIRHQNHDFLKKKTCEVQAFLKAIRFYREDKDKYNAWDMLIGSDCRVLANLVLERLLPSLQKEMIPHLKAKKKEKRRVWFATVEAAYILVQERLMGGLSLLKEKCQKSMEKQEVLIHSDMDQILNARHQLEEKVRAKVLVAAENMCAKNIQPHLGSVLEELMEPISSGFLEGRQQIETLMETVCQNVQQCKNDQEFKQTLDLLALPGLQCCYQKIASLQRKKLFGFSNMIAVIHSTQIDLKQLVENATYTFGQLVHKIIKDNPANAVSLIEKAKHRVLKQYDYDSSNVRKTTFQEALVSITLPFIKKMLAPTCKPELEGLEQSVNMEYSGFIHVNNVYEDVLLQILDKEVTKVVKEAASLRRYNLFTDIRDLGRQFSRSSLSSSSVSTPQSPDSEVFSFSKSVSEYQPNASSSSLNKQNSERIKRMLTGTPWDVHQRKRTARIDSGTCETLGDTRRHCQPAATSPTIKSAAPSAGETSQDGKAEDGDPALAQQNATVSQSSACSKTTSESHAQEGVKMAEGAETRR